MSTPTNPSSTIHTCIDRRLPIELRMAAVERAMLENPANHMPLTRGTIEHGKKWRPGRTLRVRYMDGDPRVHARISAIFPEWSNYANIKFEISNDWDAEVRISTQQPGSWAYIGTDALLVPRNKPTMNYGWFTPETEESEYRRVVLHEFGHVLGLVHEHQNPSATIPWDKQAVYSFYAGPPNNWTRAQTDRNLFWRYDRNSTQFSDFDIDSIMLYPVEQRFTIGNFEVEWNKELSETDKEFVRLHYPFKEKPTNALVVGGPPVKANIGKPGEVDTFTFSANGSGVYEIETSGRVDLVMSLFGPNDSTKFQAEDDDSGRRLNPKIVQVLRSGQYTILVRHFSDSGKGEYQLSIKKQ